MGSILPDHIDNTFQPPAHLIKSTSTSNAILAFTDKEDIDILLLTGATKGTNNLINGNHYSIGIHNDMFVVADSHTPFISGNSEAGCHFKSGIETPHINNAIQFTTNNTIQFNQPLDIDGDLLPPSLSNLVQLESGSKIPSRYLETTNQAYISFGSNVGIGTDTPDPNNRLHLYNSDALFEDSFIALNPTGDRRIAEAPLHIRNSPLTNVGGVSMKIDDSIVLSGRDGGYVGIGTDIVKGNTSLYVEGTIECSKIIVKDSFEGVLNLTDDDTNNSTNPSSSIKRYIQSHITNVALSKSHTFILTDNGNLYQKPLDDPENITLINTSVVDVKVEKDQLVITKSQQPYYLGRSDGDGSIALTEIEGLSITDIRYCETFIAYLTENGKVYVDMGNSGSGGSGLVEIDHTDISMIRGGFGYVLSYSKKYNKFQLYPSNADITIVRDLKKMVLDYALVDTDDTLFGVVIYDDGTIEYLYEGSTRVQEYRIDPSKYVSLDVSATQTVIAYKTLLHSRQNVFGIPYNLSSFAGDVWYIGDALAEPEHQNIPLKHASGLIIDGDIKVLGNIEGYSLNIVGPNDQVVVGGGTSGGSGAGVGNISQSITNYITEMNGTMDGFYTKNEIDTRISEIRVDPQDIVNVVQSCNIMASSDAWSVYGSNIFNDGGTNGVSVCINATNPNIETHDVIDIDTVPALYVASKNKNRGIVCDSDIAAFSDASLKTDISIIDEPMERIRHINGVFYKRCDEPEDSRRYAGVIAQNVEEVFPEVISTFKNKKTVSYGNMVSLLIEGMKQMDKEIRINNLALRELKEEMKILHREMRELRMKE